MDKNKLPTDKQIKQWRERWTKYPGLADEIADVLKGEKPAEIDGEAAKRGEKTLTYMMVRVFKLLWILAHRKFLCLNWI